MRLQTHATSIKCGETADIEIWLDDLPNGPPADPATGQPLSSNPYDEGVFAFDIALTYDRDVVHVGDQPAVTVPPELASAKPDAGTRAWRQPAGILNNDEGFVFTGAYDLGVDLATSDADATLPEEALNRPGIQPTAQGAPILLMKITVRAVGTGVSELRLDLGKGGEAGLKTDLLSRSGFEFAPVQFHNAAIRVEGECTAPPTSTATPGTPAPSPTRMLPIETPRPQEPPYPLPTAEPGCEWSVVTPEARYTTVLVLENSCYGEQQFGFDPTSGLIGSFLRVPPNPGVCSPGDPNPPCNSTPLAGPTLTPSATGSD